MGSNASVSISPITTNVGAVVEGVDLSKPLGSDALAKVRGALRDHGVIFFRNQVLTDPEMEAFAGQFGLPIREPFAPSDRPDAPTVGTTNLEPTKHATAVWHSDTSFVPDPPGYTALRAVDPPLFGGDTCWSSMYAAYDALSAPFQALLDGLTAVHSMAPVLKRMGVALAGKFESNASSFRRQHIHPLVRIHPDTGRKALFYNEGWTSAIVELTPAESEHIIALLREHCKSPDFAMRWRWQANDLAIWDNRCVQHYAVPDYTRTRIMQRVVTQGEVPVGPSKA